MPVISTPALRRRLEAQIREQREWMERCGGSLAGYVARYGSASDPTCYGDGGEAIYDADAAVLGALRRRLALVV